jgi:hypothetical protein
VSNSNGVVEINRRFFKENSRSLVVIVGAYIFGLAMILVMTESSAWNINDFFGSIPVAGSLVDFIAVRTPLVANVNLARVMVLYIFLFSPINFYFSMRISCSPEFNRHFVGLARHRSELQNYSAVIICALALVVCLVAVFFLFYSEAPYCSGCTGRSITFMFTTNYLGISSAGFMAGILKIFISYMIWKKT